MKFTKLSIKGFILLLLVLSACSTNDHSQIDDIIHVRNQGADMPAYIHGNEEENTFIIVLHGAGSYGLAFRDGIFTSRLEEKYVIVYWDQRGQGMSEGHYAAADDLIGLMEEDVLALVNVLKAKYGDDIKLFLMGHSWGGLLGNTVLLTGDNQSLFKGWISVDALYDVPFAARSRRGLIISIADEQILLGNLPEEWNTLKEGVSQLDSLSKDDYNPTLQYALKAMKLLNESGVVVSSISGEKVYHAVLDNNPLIWQVSNFFNKPVNSALAVDYSLSDSLYRISIPVLLLHGKYDLSVPPVLAYTAFEKISSTDKKLVIFNNSIHHPFDTEPEMFGQEVVDFIERNR